MMLILLAILGYSTQNEALFAGSVPEKASTFQVTVKGSEPFYAGIRLSGKWIEDASTEIGPRQEVELVPDAPWQTQESYRVLRSKVEMKYEASAMRRDRLRKTLSAQGYSLRETANGWRPVRDTDAQYADRMRKMAAALQRPAAEAVVAEATPAVPDPAVGGKLSRNVLSILLFAIPVVCLVAIGFVAKKLVFDRDDLQKA